MRKTLTIFTICIFSISIYAKSSIEPVKLYSQNQLQQSFNACTYVFPEDNTSYVENYPDGFDKTELCSNNFAVLYSKKTKTPLIVVENLTQKSIAEGKDIHRSNYPFFSDPRLQKKFSSNTKDFSHSGYDRGHMFSSGDASTIDGEKQSYSLTNILPQAPNNNRHVWLGYERSTRKFASRAKGDVYVFSGPIFTNGEPLTTIGLGKVWVPQYLFKLVYDEAGHRAWAFITPNTDEAKATKPVSYDEFVKITGLNLLNEAWVK